MGDAFSVAGGIVGTISLGLQVTQYIFDYYSAIKDREVNLARTIAKLERLLEVLEIIRTQVEARKTRPTELSLLSNILGSVQRCEECIKELEEEAEKFRTSPTQAHGFRAAARATVRRITYPLRQSTLQRIEEDVDDVLSELSLAQQSLIQKDLGGVRDDTGDTKALLEQVRASQISGEIRQWLNAPDATTNFNLACANKHPGTGLWFVEGNLFLGWLQKPNSFMWLRGFAGCGKSVLCSTAIQHTYQHLSWSPRPGITGIAFFYFSFSDSDKQGVEGMLRALILQLSSQLQGDPQLPSLYQRYRERTPPYQELISCLFRIVQQFTDVYIAVDALDESPRGTHRDACLQALNDMRAWSDPRLHLLVTSRDEVDIREEMQANQEEVMVMKNDFIDRDIALFISQHLRQNRRLRKWERYRDRIEEILTIRANGVFRWVECQFKALASCPRSEHLLEQLLQSLPETLDETYRRMLLNIPSASVPYACQILTLLCCSKRPLAVSELVDAVAVELGGQTPQYNPKRRLEDEYAIQEVCPGFTELGVDPGTGEPTIKIAHFSVQEYLESERLLENDDIKASRIDKKNAHAQMAHVCLTFVLDPKLAFSVEQFPFLHYAAQYWPGHFLESSVAKSVEIQILQLFQSSRSLFLNWAYLGYGYRERQVWGEMPHWDALLPLYSASYLELGSIICKLLDPPSPGHVLTGSISPASAVLNQRLSRNQTSASILSAAAGQGHVEIVRLLLERGAHPDSWSLFLALRSGFGDIAKLLLGHGADVFATDAAALCAASSSGHREMVEYLLDMGVDPNQPGHSAQTPLLEAAKSGHKVIAKLLLTRGARVDDPRIIRTAVLLSTIYSPVDIPQALLNFLSEETAGVDTQNNTLDGLLLETSRVGDLDTVRCLLRKLVDMGPQAGMIETVLEIAVHSSWGEEIVKTLLEYGVDVNSCLDIWDVYHGGFDQERMIHLLVKSAPANANLSYIAGKPALLTAVEIGSKTLIKFFLAQGVDINGRWQQGETALAAAVEFGNYELVQLLLEEGADINTQKCNPLHLSITMGRQRIVELIVKRGGDINLRDAYGWNCLHHASWTGHLSIAKLFLAQGTSPTAIDSIGRSALFLAASAGHVVVVELLLAREPSMMDQKDHYGLTPLSAAIIKGHTYVVELLVAAHPADLECHDALGKNSVWWARRRGYSDIVRVLLDEGAQRGISFGEGDLVNYPPYVEVGSGRCDICGLKTGAFVRCSLCNGGDFDICLECFRLGGRCLDDSHLLQPREK